MLAVRLARLAQSRRRPFPYRPLRYIVPFPPGGAPESSRHRATRWPKRSVRMSHRQSGGLGGTSAPISRPLDAYGYTSSPAISLARGRPRLQNATTIRRRFRADLSSVSRPTPRVTPRSRRDRSRILALRKPNGPTIILAGVGTRRTLDGLSDDCRHRRRPRPYSVPPALGLMGCESRDVSTGRVCGGDRAGKIRLLPYIGGAHADFPTYRRSPIGMRGFEVSHGSPFTRRCAERSAHPDSTVSMWRSSALNNRRLRIKPCSPKSCLADNCRVIRSERSSGPSGEGLGITPQ